MTFKLGIAAALLAAPALPALAASDALPKRGAATKPAALPAQLGTEAREQYRAVFAAVRGGQWADASAKLDAMGDGLLHPIARAELLTAKGSPKAELPTLMALIAKAPHIPYAGQLARLAATRGATELPSLPSEQRVIWLGSAPVRSRAKATRSDAAAAELSARVTPLIDENRPGEAESLVAGSESLLTPEALTEWRQRVAWSYYIVGDDSAARRLAATAQAGPGEWATQAAWVGGLAAWRQRDCASAARSFQTVALRGGDIEMRAAGNYWAARSDMACSAPHGVQTRLRAAARNPETFYGMLASEALGIAAPPGRVPDGLIVDWDRVSRTPNIRIAVALSEIGERKRASDVLRHQAKIGEPRDHDVLVRLAARLNLPEAQIWLAHNGPAGASLKASDRYPAPDWTPDRGWRVDPSLVFAHALQESNFRTEAVSSAGAQGLMQVRPGTAGDIARARGQAFDRAQLFQPSSNLEFGQSFLEGLRDSSATSGLLPKVIAAYNAGPVPIERWNSSIRHGGDPLLYIESIPYWETRGYVPIVLRNYWMYEANAGNSSVSRTALAQGQWPRFPGAKAPAKLSMAEDMQASDAN